MLLYRCLFTLALPLVVLALLLRVVRRVESFVDFQERLGLWPELSNEPIIWCHAASNGELSAARPMIEKLKETNALLITCNSVSGKRLVQSWALKNTQCRLAPLDLAWLHHRIVQKNNFRMFTLFEADFWPNRLIALKNASVPVSLIGGRISEKSAKGWARFGGLASRVFGSFDLICAQDGASEKRLQNLGGQSFGPRIALKSFYQAPRPHTPNTERARTWLAASTHQGEDEILLTAHMHILKRAPHVKMILAPRHPKRGDEIAKIAQTLGFETKQRSKGASFDQANALFIADTLGEMDKWYAASSICFVAGSLVAKGGHTPFEPLAHDCAILHGPHLENFAEPYAALATHEGARMGLNAEDVANNVLALLENDVATRQLHNARNALGAAQTLDQVLDALQHTLKS